MHSVMRNTIMDSGTQVKLNPTASSNGKSLRIPVILRRQRWCQLTDFAAYKEIKQTVQHSPTDGIIHCLTDAEWYSLTDMLQNEVIAHNTTQSSRCRHIWSPVCCAFNALYSEVGHTASEDVVLALLRTKCLTITLMLNWCVVFRTITWCTFNRMYNQ